ncbi:fatty acid desaturase [Ochromonadaceae sp. CCMP2298]|nr:fatty acid desaturase [Ochromonadaceae sp. CCMP2298]
MGKGGESAVPKGRAITLEELAAHRTPEDAWLSYQGKVYDVSNWEDHPGGSVIFTHAGDDCTDIFAAFHPVSAHKSLEKFEIGSLDESIIPSGLYTNKRAPQEQKDFEKAYRTLRSKLVAMGMFNANPVYYVYKFVSTVALLVVSVYLATQFQSFAVHMLGALFLALFWQQSGWLFHDFVHHQVFKNRTNGDMAGLILGNLFMGFSLQWWKSKHNAHHAVPNLHASVEGACDGDPDIDTMPLLAWTIKMAETSRASPSGRFMIQWQSFLYFPLLLFARLAWAHQGWVFTWGGWGQHSTAAAHIDMKKMAYPVAEKGLIALHYICIFSVMSYMPLLNGVAYVLVGQTMCGLFLAIVFGLGHNGMASYPASQRPDFWKLQVSTTRNVTSNPLVDWFCGGLQYQVDHHLFPMLPRHNLGKVHKLVESFCKEQGVTYHETTMLAGTVEVLSHLSEVSVEFVKEFPGL